ncbi:MAG: hypothetical protein A2Y38_22090 [Spirochaetes bacterium GWB1_59_5]|nr:MAG: hypothetical protein A2Y38_22090 [Spirochaetes bacterium GWB1_59_5]
MRLIQPLTIRTIAAASRFLQWSIIGLVIPVLNLLRLSKGLSLAELGFSAAITAGVVVALELPTGVLADRIGRKRCYLAALAFQVAAYASLLFASGFVAVSAALALYGVSRALSSGSLEALLIDQYIETKGDETLHRLMSTINAADTIGLALGSIAGGFIPGLWSALVPSANRYHGNLLAMLALLAVLGILVVLAVREERPPMRSGPRLGAFISESLAFMRSSKALLAILIIALAWGIAFSAIETYWQPRVVELAGSVGSASPDRLNGFLSAGYFLAALLGSLVAPLLIEKTRIGAAPLLLILRLLTAAFIVALAMQTRTGGFAILYLSMFFWNGMSSPPESTMLNRMLPSDKRASMLSAVSLAVQLGGLLGSVAFGLVVGSFGVSAAWIIAAAVLASSAFLYPIAAGRR